MRPASEAAWFALRVLGTGLFMAACALALAIALIVVGRWVERRRVARRRGVIR